MGTHPIFESDFDCLTGCFVIDSRQVGGYGKGTCYAQDAANGRQRNDFAHCTCSIRISSDNCRGSQWRRLAPGFNGGADDAQRRNDEPNGARRYAWCHNPDNALRAAITPHWNGRLRPKWPGALGHLRLRPEPTAIRTDSDAAWF